MQNTISTRRYDLDWLRLIAIIVLLFYHTGMLFNPWPWHIKNGETSETFRYWMVVLHFWRMPLLLFISGAGTYMALGKRSPKQFAGERFKRLFVPLLFGMLVIVPPQIYYEYILTYDSYWDFYKTVFEFKPYPGGSFSWHHLWFVLYLLFFSLIAIPLLTFLRSERSTRFKEVLLKIMSSPAGIAFIPGFLILITQIILRPYFPEETHALYNDWGYFTFYFCFFVFGMICYSSPQLWETIGQSRKHLLWVSIALLIPFYGCFFHFREIIMLPWSMATVETAFDVISIFLSWSLVITAIAYGQHYLNRPHRWLGVINEGLYPFYILHQTVIIVLGYYICQLEWSISLKFWAVSLLTFILCVAFYRLCISPFNVTRFLFGVKPKRRKDPAVEFGRPKG